MTVVLKLGGSVVTDKDRTETVDEAALERAAATVGEAVNSGAVSSLVVVHGAGSFGHHVADRHGVSTTAGTADATAVAEIHVPGVGREELRALLGDVVRSTGVGVADLGVRVDAFEVAVQRSVPVQCPRSGGFVLVVVCHR